MSEKLSKNQKNMLITALIIFAAFAFKCVFSLNQFSTFKIESIPYILISGIPFTILICSNLSDNFTQNLKAVDIIGIISIFYTIAVFLDNKIIRDPILLALGILCIVLILCRNIYTLIAAAGLCLLASFKLDYAAPICASAAICVSSVRFSYIFPKKVKLSSKKAKKARTELPAPDYKQEKIFFVVSELIMIASLIVSLHYRKATLTLVNALPNIEYVIPSFIIAMTLVTFAVFSFKNKRPATEFIGYILTVAAMPLYLLSSDFSIAAAGLGGLLFILFSLCNDRLMLPPSAYAEDFYGKISEAIAEKLAEKKKSAE